MTPNQITWLRLATGVVATGLVAIGSSPWMWVGCALFVLSVLLDRADGELARLTGRYSDFGHKLDLISDTLVNALIFLGAGLAARDGLLGFWAVPMGALAGAAVAAILVIVMRMEDLKGARAGELRGPAGFDPDDAILVVPLMIALGWTEPLVVVAALGAPAFALYVAWRFRHDLRNDAREST